MDDHPTGEFLWLDPDQRVPIAASPRFKVERSEPIAFLGISYAVSATRNHHAPAFAHGFVNAIDLEAHQLHFDSRGLRFVRAEYDSTLGELEVHRKCDRASWAQEDDSPHASHSQVSFALLLCECF